MVPAELPVSFSASSYCFSRRINDSLFAQVVCALTTLQQRFWGSSKVRSQCGCLSSFYLRLTLQMLCPKERSWILFFFPRFTSSTRRSHRNHVDAETSLNIRGTIPQIFLQTSLSHLFIVSSPVISFSGVSTLNPALPQHESKWSHFSSSAGPGALFY